MSFEEQKTASGRLTGVHSPAIADDDRTIAPAGTYWLELARVAFNLRFHREHDDAE